MSQIKVEDLNFFIPFFTASNATPGTPTRYSVDVRIDVSDFDLLRRILLNEMNLTQLSSTNITVETNTGMTQG